MRFSRDPASGVLARAEEVTLDPRISRGLTIKIAPDGRELFVAGLNHGARLRRDPASGAVTPLREPEDTPGAYGWQYDIAVSTDGRRLYTGAGKFACTRGIRRAAN